jgi:hypothetical protein
MRLSCVGIAVGAVVSAMTPLGGAAAEGPKARQQAAPEQLQGAWRPESVTVNGKKQEGVDLETFAGMTLAIGKNWGTLKAADDAPISR